MQNITFKTEAHNKESATHIRHIPNLCHGIYTDRFIFRLLFQPKMKIPSLQFKDVTYDCLEQCIF